MNIYGRADICSQGRITITNYFLPEKTPKIIIPVVDSERKYVTLLDAEKHPEHPGPRISGGKSKKRICLPTWVLQILGNCKQVEFVYDEKTGRKFIRPSTTKAPI